MQKGASRGTRNAGFKYGDPNRCMYEDMIYCYLAILAYSFMESFFPTFRLLFHFAPEAGDAGIIHVASQSYV